MRRHKVFATLVVLGIVGLIAGAIVIAGQQTLTTYYPAPYGAYANLTLSGLFTVNPLPPPVVMPAATNQGRIYYEGPPINRFKVSEDGGATYTDLVGGAGDWTRNTGGAPATLYPTDPTDVVGIGTTTPDTNYLLDVEGDVLVHNPLISPTRPVTTSVLKVDGAIARVEIGLWSLQQNSHPFLEIIRNAGGSQFKVVSIDEGAPGGVLSVGSSGDVGLGYNLSVAGSISTMASGVCCPDYVFEPDYPLESIEDHSAYMWENRHLKGIPGPQVGEEGKAKLDLLKTQMGMLEELEKAHLYIEQLHKRLKVLEEELVKLKEANHETP